MSKLSDVLSNARRDVFSIKYKIEMYEHERGKMADRENTKRIKDNIIKLIPLLDEEIATAKDYERWKNE